MDTSPRGRRTEGSATSRRDGIRVARLDGHAPRLAVRLAMGSSFDHPSWLAGNRSIAYSRFVDSGGGSVHRVTGRGCAPAADAERGAGARSGQRLPAGNCWLSPGCGPRGTVRSQSSKPAAAAFARSRTTASAGITSPPGPPTAEGSRSPVLPRPVTERSTSSPRAAARLVSSPRSPVPSTRPGPRMESGSPSTGSSYLSKHSPARPRDEDDSEEVTHPPQGFVDLAASWSPDGSRLAYVRKING